MFPKTLDEKFLNNKEIEDIQDRVLSLEKHWQGDNIKTLPYGKYLIDEKLYSENVLKYKDLLNNNFSVYYDKIQNQAETFFGKPARYHNEYNKPGFHIFKGPYTFKDNFHFDKFNVEGNIFSFIVPIVLPSVNGGLLYTVTKGIKEKFLYIPGALHVWGGNIEHSILPFTINKNEYRITMQYHIAVTDNECIIFW